MYTGLVNVLFDLREVSSFELDNAYIFADIYKICAQNGGKFVIINPSASIKEALSFAYLSDVITIANSVEDGVAFIMDQKN